jgi:hypothetical protein
MGLKDILRLHQIPFDDAELDARMDLVIAGLKRSPDYADKLRVFQSQKGGQVPGQVPDDFLGPRLNQFVDVITSPYAREVIRGIFMVIFFMSYLEKIPVFGSILSAALDLMLAGGKMLTKTIQKAIPPMMGLLPIPFASIVGLGMAAVFGMIVWPLIAIVSFSRQDFVAAIDSFVRVVPPPFGDTIADVFMDANRVAGRLDAKRKKLGEDISNAIRSLGEVMQSFKEKANTLADKTQAAASTLPALPALPSVPAPKVGGRRHRLSKKTSRHKKWKTRRQRK